MADPYGIPDPFAPGPAGMMATQAENTPKPTPNPYGIPDPFEQEPAKQDPSSTSGAFGRSAALGVAPAAGGFAGAAEGAEIGATIGGGFGSLAGPGGAVVGGGVGAFVGGFAGAIGGGYLAGKAQDVAAAHILPPTWKDALDKQQMADEQEHPIASFLGGMLPMALTMNPFSKAGPVGETAIKRIMNNPTVARLFGGAVFGGTELGNEAVSGQDIDWRKVAISSVFGLVFNRPNVIGEAIEGAGARPVVAARNALGIPDFAARGRSVLAEREAAKIAGEKAAAPPTEAAPPTVNNAQDTKTAGLGINEEVFKGSQKQDPVLEARAQEAARVEAAIVGPPDPPPDIHSVVAKMEPELIAEHDGLVKQKEALADVGGPALAATDKALDEITPKVAAAYRVAAEVAGTEKVPAAPIPAEAGAPSISAEPAKEPAKPLAQQKAEIANDVQAKLVASGRPLDEAIQAGKIYAAEIASMAERFGGRIGTAEEVYAREGAVIKGQDGKTRRLPPSKIKQEKVEAKTEARPAEEPKLTETVTDKKGNEWREIGVNRDGKKLWEDQRGVHSITEDGIRSTEPVRLSPTGKIATDRANHPEYELAKPDQPTSPKTAEVSEKAAPPPEPSNYGANNTIISKDRYAQIQERLRKKIKDAASQLNSGFDPEFAQLGMEAAAYHLEAGVRKFAEFSAIMARDLGSTIAELKPYIRSWFVGGRTMLEDSGVDVSQIDTPEIARAELERVLTEEANARTAIHEESAEPLAEVVAGNDEGIPQGGDTERGGSESEQTRVGADRQPDDEGVSETRSGGDGSPGHDTVAPREKVTKQRKRIAKIAVETRAENPTFTEDPSVSERETAPINVPDTDFVLTDEMNIGKGTEGQKYADNIAAIKALKVIEAENRRATPEEKAILARYVGWGGLKNAFRVAGSDDGVGVASGWERRVAELESLLTPTELRRARNSTAAAHYTSPTVVKAIWNAVDRLGFSGGSVLEPSVGTGNFIGFMPEHMRGGANIFAVEYDNLTARIAQKLYPRSDIIHAGFQDVPLPENQFALAIGNPPFGSDRLNFRHNPSVNGKTIHNQFFLASLDGVRPGGMMAMVVSHNMMDALDNSARLSLAAKGDFLGAIRLPDTAFKENARTEVVTDIVFLRKREADEQELAETASRYLGGELNKAKKEQLDDPRYKQIENEINKWVHSSSIDDPAGSGESINANGYFLNNPDMVIGKINATGTMNRRAELNVTLDNPAEFDARMEKAVGRLRTPFRRPSEDIAAASLTHYKGMVEGMKLAVEHAEPGRIVKEIGGGLKTVVDIDAGEGRAKSVLREIPLTKDTPFKPEYTMNIDGKWQKTEDVLGPDGKPVKTMRTKITPDGTVEVPTNRNEKRTIVYDKESDIPERDRWGEDKFAAVNAMLPIRDAFRKQLQLEMQDAPKEMIEANRAELNEAYDKFVEKHGSLNDPKNAKIAMTMPDGGLIVAAEHVKKNGSVEKAPIMSRRVTEPPKPVERARDVNDAVAISLGERGKIDLDRIASLLETDEAGAIKALSEGEHPRAFYDPETSTWLPRDEYLSGLVRKRLLAAREAGLDDNVKALEKVIPEDQDSSTITPNIGSSWIPPDVYAGFLKHLGYDESFVHYSEATNTFTVDYKGNASPEWATTGTALETGEIFGKLLNSQPIKVTYRDHDGNVHVDEVGTAESQAKANEVFNEFLDWAYKDNDQRHRLVRIFNDKFNTRVNRQRDGSHLTYPGKVPDELIKMRRHQDNAIWRGITDPAVLYDHVVGSGKTFTAISRIMERRRMGLSNKPMVVVPNHLVLEWAGDFKRLYPGSNVLAAEPADFTRENRRRLFARVAAGDYDAVIMGHSSFGFIDIDPSTEERYLDEELRSARSAVEDAEKAAAESGYSGWGKPMGVKEAERLVTKIETRLSRLREGKRDRLLTWEEMGIDDLTVDEAHEFKNLAYSSRLSGVSGMGNKAGSDKASELNLKIRSLQDRPGTSVAFLTGTPISNSVAEMYLILRNLVPKELKELGIENFDAWRSMFVSYASAYEPTEAGGVKEVTRLGREWMNMKALMDLYYSVSDAVTMDDIKKSFAEDNPGKEFPIPKVASKVAGGGDREMVYVPPTREQRGVLKDIVRGFNELPGLKPPERNIERLKLMDQARKISLDPRAVDPRAFVSGEGGKIRAITDRVSDIYKKWDADKGTQIIFLDRSVPKAKGDEKIVAAYDELRDRLKTAMENADEKVEQKAIGELEKYNPNEIEALRSAVNGGWNAYDEIKRQLVEKGIPEDQIKFVQEASNNKQKKEMFEKMRNGEIRVLIGSTPRMGAGTNVQDRLVALHHGDVTWKPSDIEQREGRIVRQGNKFIAETLPDGSPNPDYKPNFAVDVVAYSTEMTIDAKMWALNAGKLKAINGVRKYDGSYNMEFEDEESASMAEMAALATGNPKMVERVTLGGDIGKLEIQQRAFTRRQNALRDQLTSAQRDVKSAPDRAARSRDFAGSIEKNMGPIRERAAQRSLTMEGKDYHDIQAAYDAAKTKISEIKGGDANARFSIDIGGEKFTSIDAVETKIRSTLGAPNFESEVDGKTLISWSDTAAEIMAKAEGKSGEFTLDGIKINGVPLEVDVAPCRYAPKESEIAFAMLNDKGQEMAGYRTIAKSGLTRQGVYAAIEKLVTRDMSPENYRRYADEVEAKAASEAKKVPNLQTELEKPWAKAEELQKKRERLSAVIEELKGSSDALRLGDDAEDAGGEEDFSEREHDTDEEETNAGGRQLQQSAFGKIHFKPHDARATITIMRDANASTAIHEFGHDFLERMRRYALHDAAPDSLKQDWSTVKKWIGVKDDAETIPTKGHEKFARGFVEYLHEGRAPSPELATVFQKFRDWLAGLYRTIKGLGEPINDDIRRVFDRMLSSEPRETVIAPDKEHGPTLQTIHEADAAETPATEAHGRADQIVAERDEHIAEHVTPEVRHELETKVAEIQSAEGGGQGGEGNGEATPGAQLGGQTGENAVGSGPVGEGGGEPGPVSGGGDGGEKLRAVEPGGGDAVSKGEHSGGPTAEPDAAKLAGFAQPAPRPADTLGPSDSRLTDKAGNIRIENLTDRADVAKAIYETAEKNNDFIGDRRGVITDGQVLELADALGMDAAMLSRRKLGEAFNAEQIKAARMLLRQSATRVSEAMKRAAEGTDDDVLAYAEAKNTHQMIQGQVAGLTAEWGRAGRAFRKLPGDDAATATSDFIAKQATGKTLYQLKAEAKMGAALDTPEKVSKFMADAHKRSFGDMVLEYWINGLISGPATHVTYSIGNSILAAVRAGPETLAAAAIGAIRNREGGRVYAGESGAQFRGLREGNAPAMKAAFDSAREGVTAALPKYDPMTGTALPFQEGSGLAHQPEINENATYGDAASSAFAILRGIRDGMTSGAAILKAGGIEGEPTWGLRSSNLGVIPDVTFKGVNVAPIGTLARLPSRGIAAIHSYFRTVNYSMEKSALAYRQAMEEVRTGIISKEQFSARVGELWQNPTENMMASAAREATEATLMGQGSAFTQTLARLTNTPVFGIKLLKFVDPFVKISSNIIDQALLERSPLGLISPEIRANLLGKNGNIAQDKAMARMLLGTAMGIGFGGLAASGYASGSGPSDPRQAAMWRLAGNQAHSVRIGDMWYDVHRLGPMGMIMSVAADMYDVAHIAESGELLKAGAALQHAITQNILDESFMRGPADLIKAIEDPGRYGEAYLRNWASSFVPYSVGMAQMARAADPYSRQARTVMDAIKNKIPGESETLLPRRDIWGEPILNPDALAAKGLTVIYEKQMSTDPVNLAMVALGMGPAQVEKTIRNVPLDPNQYDEYSRIAGRMAKMRLDKIVGSGNFRQWPPNVQHDVIVETIRQSRESARGVMMMKYPSIMATATQAKLDRARGITP